VNVLKTGCTTCVKGACAVLWWTCSWTNSHLCWHYSAPHCGNFSIQYTNFNAWYCVAYVRCIASP
jgi:hypothetical protein